MSSQNRYLKLIDILENEIKIYRHLLELVRREKEILISPDLEELNKSNEAKEAMVSKLKKLERERQVISRELAEDVGANSDSPRLMEIATKFDQIKGDKLRSLHATLELLVKRIREYNHENERLVRSALENIQGAMGAIKNQISEKSTYQKGGKLDNQAVSSGEICQ